MGHSCAEVGYKEACRSLIELGLRNSSIMCAENVISLCNNESARAFVCVARGTCGGLTHQDAHVDGSETN